ncbi:MAG: 23S rRNA (pseudouridine(1915)-N(3))-methyltransferase RlmH [Burkholderiales bacterium]|nr:23S rRNA (pseudouridine(1915)-N(3))-methyltransferase RlmH [Burkholderiales bacterium]
MRLVILAVGHRQPSWVDIAFHEYAKRMPRELRIELVELRPEPRPDNAGEAAVTKLLEREAARIEQAQPKGALRVVLDEAGEALATRALSARFERWLGTGRDIAFVIGSADGLHSTLKTSAEQTLSLSPLTLPHGLARVLLAEQLYRAHALLRGHPYHRD